MTTKENTTPAGELTGEAVDRRHQYADDILQDAMVVSADFHATASAIQSLSVALAAAVAPRRTTTDPFLARQAVRQIVERYEGTLKDAERATGLLCRIVNKTFVIEQLQDKKPAEEEAPSAESEAG